MWQRGRSPSLLAMASTPATSPTPSTLFDLPDVDRPIPSPGTHIPSDIWASCSNAVYRAHHFPEAFQEIREPDRLRMAYLWETCDMIQDEVNIAERRYNLMILAVRASEIQFREAQVRLQQALQQRSIVMDAALREHPPARPITPSLPRSMS